MYSHGISPPITVSKSAPFCCARVIAICRFRDGLTFSKRSRRTRRDSTRSWISFFSLLNLHQPPPGVEELRRGTKRSNPESALALVEPKVVDRYHHHSSASASAGLSEAPLCRPWDRGDLMRRVATFKSMTWFAKPKVVSAVNCARRGWINVDTDTIACESCGALEKAALVFSLKLDNGHKLLCPWIDNICDETLAQFPPMPPPVLVEKFRERSSALIQLLALPVISPSAIEYMRSTQLEEFLKWFPILECGNEAAKGSETDSLSNQCQDNSANLYYQAEKLISLCGWEPRSLPYVVDCEDGVNQFVDDVNGQNPSVNVHSAGSKEIVEVTEDYGAHKSVVLDCRLCGASVGLWAFATVARPVEFFRVVGDTEVNGENHCGSHVSGNENHVGNMEVAMNTVSNGEPSHTESSSHLNLTIAGGPPPTKQNFKATISFPVVGRALRAKFSYDSDFRDYTFDHPKEIQSTSRNNNLPEEGKDRTENNLTGQVVLAEDAGSLNRGQYDHGSDSSINEETLGKENNDHAPLEGPSVTGQDTFPGAGTGCAIVQSSTETTQNEKLGQSQSDMLAENGEQSKNEGSLVIPSGSAVMAGSAGMDPKQLQEVNAMKFDPIRQHRHFCPWIVSTGGALPGWQQTLSALHRQRDRSYSSPADSSPSSSLIKVDDPIASVRKLFTSPVAKRMKSTHGSS
ncbi:hypothetical protein CUMW_202680 [Citrus unshiu]|uniref:C3HC-type domain-containing protein n=1 Tax=Citrus unshiu TaxID=55188 RepID=A0A2H5Q8D8_CITUN|nr:hypothetical protein CUMW_202680 [Citrus unshiu]